MTLEWALHVWRRLAEEGDSCMHAWWHTRRLSPGWRCTVMKTVDQTVDATSGIAAASRRDTPFGIGNTWPSGTFTFSAYPPPPSNAHTCSGKQRNCYQTRSETVCFFPPCGNPCCCCSTTKKLITIYNNQASKASSSSSSSLLQAYLVSDFPFGNSRADALYGSRDFKAQVQRSAWRWRIVALSLHDVCSVQCSRSRFDEHFSLACFRIRDLPDLQDFRTAWLGNLDGPHLVVVAAANLVETISLRDGLSTPESNLFLFLFLFSSSSERIRTGLVSTSRAGRPQALWTQTLDDGNDKMRMRTCREAWKTACGTSRQLLRLQAPGYACSSRWIPRATEFAFFPEVFKTCASLFVCATDVLLLLASSLESLLPWHDLPFALLRCCPRTTIAAAAMDGDSTGTTTTVGSARGQRAGQTIMEDRERSFSGVRNPGLGLGGGSGGRNCSGLEAAHRRECTGRAADSVPGSYIRSCHHRTRKKEDDMQISCHHSCSHPLKCPILLRKERKPCCTSSSPSLKPWQNTSFPGNRHLNYYHFAQFFFFSFSSSSLNIVL